MSDEQDDRIVPIDEAADIAKVSRASFYRLFSDLPRYAIGARKMGVMLGELKEAVRAREAQPATPVLEARPNFIRLQAGGEIDLSQHRAFPQCRLICVEPSLHALTSGAVLYLPRAQHEAPFGRPWTIVNNAGISVKMIAADGEAFLGKGSDEYVTRSSLQLSAVQPDGAEAVDTWAVLEFAGPQS